MLKELLYDYKVPSDKKVTDFDVKVSNIQVVRDFVESWHYSKSVNGLRISHVFGLYCEDNLIGAMIYGPLGMEVMHERNAHNFPLDLASAESTTVALTAPSIG